MSKPGKFEAAIQVLLCCGQFASQGAIFGVLTLAGVKPGSDAQPNLVFFASLVLIDTAVVLGLMVVFLRASGESIRVVFFGARPARGEVEIGLLAVPAALVGAGVLSILVRAALPWLHNVPENPYVSFSSSVPRAAIFIVCVIIGGGVREEAQRAFFLHRVDQTVGHVWIGLAAYSIFFGAMHIVQGYDAAVVVGTLGLSWGILYIRRRSVLAPVISHAGFDTAQVLLQMVALRMK